MTNNFDEFNDFDISSVADDDDVDIMSSSTKGTQSGTKTKKNKMSDSMKTRVTAICCLAAIALTLVFSYFYLRGTVNKNEVGKYNITVSVVCEDKDRNENLKINTSAEYLGAALASVGYIDTDDLETGIIKRVSSVTASGDAKWIFTDSDGKLLSNITEAEIHDGDSFTATCTGAVQ